MSNTLEMPFTIRQEMWEPLSGPQSVRVPCPVCFGKLAVTVILGDGERVGVACDACESGYQGPRGYVDEWRWEPAARRFVIAAVRSMHGRGDWVVETEDGRTYNYANLFATEAEALAEAQARTEREMERQCDTRQRKRKVERAPWSVRYHKAQIRELERKLAWHQGKLSPAANAVGLSEQEA